MTSRFNTKLSSANKQGLRLGIVIAGFAALVLAAYIDNVRGPILPAITTDLGLGYGLSSLFLATGHLAAVFGTFSLISLLARWGERSVTLSVLGLSLLAMAIIPAVNGMTTLLLLAAVLGSVIAMLGALCNILVIEGAPGEIQSKYLSGLHTMYGLTSACASAIAGGILAAGWSWHYVFYICIPAILFFAGAIATRMPARISTTESHTAKTFLSPLQYLAVGAFGFYVAGEVMTSMWLVTFLMEAKRVPSVAEASLVLAGFFGVMTVSRAFCFFFYKVKWERMIVWGSLIIPLIALILGHLGSNWAFIGVGLVGPFFPVCLGRLSRIFPADWRSITVWILVVMQVLIGSFHFSVGQIIDRFGVELAFQLPIVLLGLAIILLWLFEGRLSKGESATPGQVQ